MASPSTRDVRSVTLAAFRLPAGRFKPIFSSFSLSRRPPFLLLALQGDGKFFFLISSGVRIWKHLPSEDSAQEGRVQTLGGRQATLHFGDGDLVFRGAREEAKATRNRTEHLAGRTRSNVPSFFSAFHALKKKNWGKNQHIKIRTPLVCKINTSRHC